MADIYEQRGYGSQALGFGAKPGVVVVDFQRGFTEAGFARVPTRGKTGSVVHIDSSGLVAPQTGISK